MLALNRLAMAFENMFSLGHNFLFLHVLANESNLELPEVALQLVIHLPVPPTVIQDESHQIREHGLTPVALVIVPANHRVHFVNVVHALVVHVDHEGNLAIFLFFRM
jgi:hypothetical protein